MIGHTTFGIQATNARTWVHALLVDTGFVARAITVHHALRTTAAVRIAEVARLTRTGAGAVAFTALSIGAAGRWLTGSKALVGFGHSCGSQGTLISGSSLKGYGIKAYVGDCIRRTDHQ